MAKSIIEYFDQLPDERRTAGQRHSQSLVLVLVLMSTMSGCLGYRAMGDFIRRHKEQLLKYLRPPKDRLPSFDTVRRVLINLDFSALSQQFRAWALQYVSLQQGEYVSLDGKAISGTSVVQSEHQKQAFTSLVSAYCSKQHLVVGNASVLNQKESEIPVVQTLIEALDLQGVTFTADALHCQKKQQPSL